MEEKLTCFVESSGSFFKRLISNAAPQSSKKSTTFAVDARWENECEGCKINKPRFWLAGSLANDVLGWEIVLKISHLLSKLCFQILIFRTIFQPRTLSAAWRGWLTNKCKVIEFCLLGLGYRVLVDGSVSFEVLKVCLSFSWSQISLSHKKFTSGNYEQIIFYLWLLCHKLRPSFSLWSQGNP